MDVTGQRSFALGNCLGKGGFGEVYRATMSSSGGLSREVAVKLLRADLDMHDDAVRRLRDEGRLLAGLDHPALLKVYDLVELAGRVALVTEFIDGEDLTECFRARPAMPVRPLLQAIAKVAEALHVAWTAPLGPNGRALRLVHRDIKPSNLRIGKHGQVKVLDFGIARSDEVARESRTSTDLIIGSPAYMAPERFLDNEVRSASDVFALGCCLYEGLMQGKRLFGRQSAMVLSTLALDSNRFYAFLDDHPLPETVPEAVRDLVAQCLEHNPDARPTARDLSHRCEELADELSGPSLSRWARQREWPTGAVPVPSAMAGQVVTEGSLAMSVAQPTTEQLSRGTGVYWFMGSAAAGLGAVAVAALIAVGLGVAWQQGMFDAEPDAPPAVQTDPAPERLVNDTAAPVVDPTPADVAGDESDLAPLVSPPTTAPEPVGEGVPEPAPVEPAPVEPAPAEPEPTRSVVVTRVPDPEPEPVATGVVQASGSMSSISLVAGGRRIDLSTSGTAVPVGVWTIHSNDPVNGAREHGVVTVSDGSAITVNCSQAMASCRVR